MTSNSAPPSPGATPKYIKPQVVLEPVVSLERLFCRQHETIVYL